jgi:hypothetical protein
MNTTSFAPFKHRPQVVIGACARDNTGAGSRQQRSMASDGAYHQLPAATTALDVRIHAALNLGRPLSAVRVEARVGASCQVSASVSAEAGVACFNAWGRLPVPDLECAESLQLQASVRLLRGRAGGRAVARVEANECAVECVVSHFTCNMPMPNLRTLCLNSVQRVHKHFRS